jgi:phosphoserine phosphatase
MVINLFCVGLFAETESAISHEVIESLVSRAKELKANSPGVSLAFFVDWDGTMIKGDITEGLHQQSSEDYMGLAERAFELKLIRIPEGEKATYSEYKERYETLLLESHEKAYAWSSEFFANLDARTKAELEKMVRIQFQQSLGKRVFNVSASIVTALHELGVEVYVISASPSAFVEGTTEVFEWLTLDHVYGINRNRQKGKLTDPVINYAEGKVKRIDQILNNKGNTIILGGMGNSWGTDGAFLKEIAERGGVSVMFNGGQVLSQYDHPGIRRFNINETLGVVFI